ncbi:MAG TPA: thioesterase, partial [Bacteroidales bacterium]|nr:thioesterase [Bacteroidales bacterium]
MTHILKQGIKGEFSWQVVPENTAEAYKSGNIPVFATPAMIALMENTAHLSVQPLLDEGYVTVGTEVNIKHIKATPV